MTNPTPTAPTERETLAPWCDREGCRQPPDDTITVAMFPNANGETPWVHAACTGDDTDQT